jgi:signal transduction histidine kinase/ligand-binding sensor domain-containing protein
MLLWQIILVCAGLMLPVGPGRAAVTPDEAIPVSGAWQYRAWQTDEGLPDNSVTGVAQTADGFLWVATFGGLMRFNGTRFEEFSVMHLPDVPNRVVRLMFLDPKGRFWLAMDRGPLVCVDQTTAQVFTSRDGLLETRVSAFAADGAGGVWLAYADDIVHVTEGKITRLDAKIGLPAGGANWVADDARGQAWFARGGNVGTLRDGRWQPEWSFSQLPVRFGAARASGLWVCAGNGLFRAEAGHAPVELVRLPTNVVVQALFEDRAGALWIATSSHGLFHWNDGNLEKVPTANSQISCLTEDREGNIWVGTAGGGLNRLRLRAVDVIGVAEGLPFESMRSVCEDAGGVRWAVADNGLLLHTAGGKWTPADARVGWRGAAANCVTADREGAVWIGLTSPGLVRLQGGKMQEWRRAQGLTGNYVRSVLAATNGDVWVATGSPSRLHRLRAGRLQPLEMSGDLRSIRALAETTDGTIWAGTSEGQLLRVNPEALTVETIVPEERPLSIRFLHATADGSLWIGYAGWGVGRWKDGHHVRVTAAQGLYDDYVSQILADDRGELWMNSNHGLFTVRLQDLVEVAEGRAARVRCIVYGRGEGLPSLQPRCDYFPSAWRMQDGTLFYALRNGLAVAQPHKMRDNPEPPPVVLERVTVDDLTVARYDYKFPLLPADKPSGEALQSMTAPLRLPPRHQKLEFQFAALSYSSPENVQFRYQLKNFDQNWNESGPTPSARYPRLAAGNYEFQVQACNEAGVWNEVGFRLNLAVLPFFWQTWWFRFGVLATFTAGVVGVVRYFSFRRLQRELARLEQQAALHRERTRIARDMHDEVGSKLSRLSLLSEMASHQPEMPAAARGEVAEISETARDTIRSFEEIVWAVNPRNDSLANLVHYLCRFAEDFFEGSPTQCVFDVPDEIPPRELPTELRHHVFLAAKEALNNVLKHANACQVCVRLRLRADGFEIAVEDDGCGFGAEAKRPRPGSGNGLENMRERMKSVGGELSIQPGSRGGTWVTFRIRGPRQPGG